MIRNFKGYLALLIVFSACSKPPQKYFESLSSSTTDIHFKNELRDTPELNILTYLYYYNGAGVAAADFNNDGLTDLYFTSNQGEDNLYINQGGLRFADVTESANISNKGNWTTGVTHADINGDGLLDIYICKVGNYGSIKGQNLLYINQGMNADGNPVFLEDGASYGLDFSGFSTQAAFFDYDLDGDLDMFLMNHSIHPNRTYGDGKQREGMDPLSGDRLFRNDSGKFVDVSLPAGIYQGKIGYGLGLAISDVNSDGYADIYVGNDFFENDYLYLNQADGTFKEVISENNRKLGHTSHYSMGNEIADINNDGLPDILSLDMLPENLMTYKTSGLEFPYPTYASYLKNGYAPQYMQNTLHLNLGNGSFGEIANFAGIPATDWSWGALVADYDNDGFKDVYISNGIKGATNDMDFINFIANEKIQKRLAAGMSSEDMDFIKELPKKNLPNYLFQNNGNLTFSDESASWLDEENSYSNGCTYADLDNDGDLDIVVNNLDQEAYVLENHADKLNRNQYLQFYFKGDDLNAFGIGVKVLTYTKKSVLALEHFPCRGYLSSVSNVLHIGLGSAASADSVKVIWPNGKFQTLESVAAGQRLLLNIQDAAGNYYKSQKPVDTDYLLNVTPFIPFVHKENVSLDFNRDPLVPYANSNNGPDISVADVNKDGLDDIFLGGGKAQASALFVQNPSGSFDREQEEVFQKDALSEDVSQVFFDANNDGSPDLLVVSGGNEYRQGNALRPRLYLNFEGKFVLDSTQFRDISINASKVAAIDIDQDGDLDVTMTSDQKPWHYGENPEHYIFFNDGHSHFSEVTTSLTKEFRELGNIKDFEWVDLDGNGYPDLLAVGHWMPITIFLNDGKSLKLQENNGLTRSNGWWNSVTTGDFDRDGDIDIVAGNWGLNSKLKASAEQPMTLFRSDFDSNGSVESLITYFHGDQETPFASKDELVKQMPFLNKKFLSYSSFAKARVTDMFSQEKLESSMKKKAFVLASSYFVNDGNGQFNRIALPEIAQTSVIKDITTADFNKDGYKDLLIVGNMDEISTQLGRMDALHGVILLNDTMGHFYWSRQHKLDIPGPARHIRKISRNGRLHYIVSINNNNPVFLRAKNE